MKVREILNKKSKGEVTTISPEALLGSAMTILIEKKISCLPVLDEDKSLKGIVSDKDIFHCVHAHPKDFAQKTVASVMTTDLIVGVQDDLVDYVAGLMTNNRIRHIPIMDGSVLVGLVSVGDVVKARISDMQVENRYLKQYIIGDYPG